MKSENILKWLLRLLALAHVGALIGLVLPVAFMAAAHARLGLGEFPARPIVIYLVRSLSALYALYGGILWICAGDIRRYAAIIRYFCLTGLLFAVLMTVVGTRAGFPWYWVMSEGPSLGVICVIFLMLLKHTLRAEPSVH